MRVHHHAGLAEGPAQDHVRGLATDAMELQQLLHRLGHDTPELLVQRPRHLHDRPRLLPVEASRADEVFELGEIRGGEIGGGPIAREQRRGDLVHLGVGALGREDRRHEQLQRIPVFERQTGDRVALAEDGGDSGGAGPGAGKRLTGGKLRSCNLGRNIPLHNRNRSAWRSASITDALAARCVRLSNDDPARDDANDRSGDAVLSRSPYRMPSG